MLIIEQFRKIVKKQLGHLWEDVQREVKEYFNIRDFAIIEYRKNYHKLDKPNEVFLKDPLNISEIHKLLYFIKEYNFNYETRTHSYFL